MIYKIADKPIAQKRPRFSYRGVYDPQAIQKNDCKFELRVQHRYKPYFTGPISMKITFFMPIPKSTTKKKAKELLGSPHIKKPDVDNLVKWVLDCSNNVLYKDDSIVYSLSVCKKYSDNPRTEFTISEVENE